MKREEHDVNDLVIKHQVVGTRSGFYRTMLDLYKPLSHEWVVQTGLTYRDACLLADQMNQVQEVQDS